jgi:hypothetical protein
MNKSHRRQFGQGGLTVGRLMLRGRELACGRLSERGYYRDKTQGGSLGRIPLRGFSPVTSWFYNQAPSTKHQELSTKNISNGFAEFVRSYSLVTDFKLSSAILSINKFLGSTPA